MPDLAAKLTFSNGKTLEFHGPADITKETTDAIVNAANSSLLGGGGVDGAIHRAGGPSILEECRRIVAKIGSLSAGKAVITTGGRLPAKYVVHTVGPIYRGGRQGEAETLASCYCESIRVADDHGIPSRWHSLPSRREHTDIPSRRRPKLRCEPLWNIFSGATHLDRIRFVLFSASDCSIYIRAAKKISRELPASSAVFDSLDSSL